jgi:hypothetical protein
VLGIDQVQWTAQLVAGIEALAPEWHSLARWWISPTERATLKQREGEAIERRRHGDYATQ